MFDLTTYVKKWRIRQLKTVFSTLDTLCPLNTQGLTSLAHSDNSQVNNVSQVFLELVTWSWRTLGLV